MVAAVALSQTASAIAWIKQFPFSQQQVADQLLDQILLLDDNTVSNSILALLDGLDTEDRVALYAEREVARREIFTSELIPKGNGLFRRRATGKAPPAVLPERGAHRVGSEGYIAFLISQAVKWKRKRFVNNPKPDQFRKVGKRGIHTIAIVTDFIGTGARIRRQLDAFWNVPSITSWHSMGLLRFKIIAAAATQPGIEFIEKHSCNPEVKTAYVVPTLLEHKPFSQAVLWRALAESYGPTAEPLGFQDLGALVAFRYGMPNNTPKILWDSSSRIRPFMPGPASADILIAFSEEVGGFGSLRRAFRALTLWLKDVLPGVLGSSPERAKKILFLNLLKGRWQQGREIHLAKSMGLTVPEIIRLREEAKNNGWIGVDGRLTDSGRNLIKAIRPDRWTKPVVKTNPLPYYPRGLRIP
ncbi:MAG: hypothetical protein J0I19_12135 [Alphaproteobacteria bacterium]|nr:hypothetical protein [Alphaproteobacteria bacterium]